MTLPRVFVAAAAVVLLLAGCAPAAEVASSPIATPEPTASVPEPSPTPEVVEPASVVVSLDTLSIRETAGAEPESVPFTDPAAMLTLLSEVLGSTPVPVDNGQGGLNYQWPGLTFLKTSDFGTLHIFTTEMGGLPVSTSQGIHVGSSRAEIEALSPFEGPQDTDGDGAPDFFGLEPREMAGTVSLWFPGQVGTGFIWVVLQDDVVVYFDSPFSDYVPM